MPDSTCHNCKFWNKAEAGPMKELSTVAECRRYAPSVISNSTSVVITSWPLTKVESWCGDWQQEVGPPSRRKK